MKIFPMIVLFEVLCIQMFGEHRNKSSSTKQVRTIAMMFGLTSLPPINALFQSVHTVVKVIFLLTMWSCHSLAESPSLDLYGFESRPDSLVGLLLPPRGQAVLTHEVFWSLGIPFRYSEASCLFLWGICTHCSFCSKFQQLPTHPCHFF